MDQNPFDLHCIALSREDSGARDEHCRAPLEERDELTLVCTDTDCLAEYPVLDGIPTLLTHDTPKGAASYDDELMALAYVEMNFASYRTDLPTATTAASDPYRAVLDDPDPTGPFYRATAERVAGLVHTSPGETKVLDVACGMGRMVAELRQVGLTGPYLGIDLSRRLVSEATRVFLDGAKDVRMPVDPGRGPRSEVVPIDLQLERPIDRATTRFAVGDATRLPVDDGAYEVVMGLNLVDRVDDPAQVVKELWRAVAPGGLLVLADPFHWMSQPHDRRIYSFAPVTGWLDAVEAERAKAATAMDDAQVGPTWEDVSGESIVFATRRRDSRRVVVYDDAVAIFRKLS